MAGEIFISYRRADQDKARLLHALLKQRGVDAWYDALLGAGEDWRHKTAHALNAAPIFVLLFSKTASESDDISKELAAATFSKKLVIPVRIDNIRPEGAFLYELASRNWFDAFENTEARFEILADQLAALVKGGPAAEVAAFNLGSPQPAPTIKPAAKKKGSALPLLVGAVVLVAALVGGAFYTGLLPLKSGPAAVALSEQRTAFFGFAVDSGDTVAAGIARSTADEIFQTMSAYNLETASRAKTEGIALVDQIDRAQELGAAWALGGDVRTNGDKVTVTMRLDDVAGKRTMWQDTVTGSASETISLPVLAAAKASRLMRGLVSFRDRIRGEDATADERIKTLYPRAAADLFTPTPETLKAWREIVNLAPKSADAEAELAFALLQALQTAPVAERLALFQEMGAAAKRSVELDKTNALARGILVGVAVFQGRPLAEVERELLATIEEAPKDGPMAGAYLTNPYGQQVQNLMAAGRFGEALPRAQAMVRADPMNPTVRISGAITLAFLGSPVDAQRMFEESNARFPGQTYWEAWMTFSTFVSSDSFEKALASAPPGLPGDAVGCWRDIGRAAQSLNDAQARRSGLERTNQCLKVGGVSPPFGPTLKASFGDLDGAFASAEGLVVRTNTNFRFNVAALYAPSLRAMRADPRFLALMQKATVYQYWLDTGTHPDVCDDPAEKDFPVCVALRKDQAK